MAEKIKAEEVNYFSFLISNLKIGDMTWTETLVNNLKMGMNLFQWDGVAQ